MSSCLVTSSYHRDRVLRHRKALDELLLKRAARETWRRKRSAACGRGGQGGRRFTWCLCARGRAWRRGARVRAAAACVDRKWNRKSLYSATFIAILRLFLFYFCARRERSTGCQKSKSLTFRRAASRPCAPRARLVHRRHALHGRPAQAQKPRVARARRGGRRHASRRRSFVGAPRRRRTRVSLGAAVPGRDRRVDRVRGASEAARSIPNYNIDDKSVRLLEESQRS